MKRISLVFVLSLLSLGMWANSPLNFGLNFRVNMPRSTYESTDWNGLFDQVNEGDYDVDNVDIDQSQLGYAGGVFLRFNKGKGFLHTEGMFSFNSTDISSIDNTDPTRPKTVVITQEETDFYMPIYLGRNLINSTMFKVRAFTGPTLRWKMNSTYTADRDGVDLGNFDSDVDLDNFSWLWTVGAGVELFMFSLDARYGFNVKGINGTADASHSFNQKTNMVEFTLGFKLF